MAHTRSDDPPVKITREIPLPWLVGIVAIGVFQAILIWFNQQAQTEQIKTLGSDVRALSVDIGAKNLKDVEHDLKLSDHERRIVGLEARKVTP